MFAASHSPTKINRRVNYFYHSLGKYSNEPIISQSVAPHRRQALMTTGRREALIAKPSM